MHWLLNTRLMFKDILTKKNAIIHDLQFELARVCKAHDDTLEKLDGKIRPYGLSKEDLGVTYIRSAQNDDMD